MVKKLWNWLIENFKEVLAVCTAGLTVIYTAFRLVAYVYWYGYFKRLNIDSRFIKVDYEGTIFQVVFFFVVVLVMIYMMDYWLELVGTTAKRLWKKDVKWYSNLLPGIVIAFWSALSWAFFGSIANVPLIVTLCVYLEIEINALIIIGLAIIMSIVEIFCAIVMKISNHESDAEKQSLTSKITVALTMGVICTGIVLAGTYYSGSIALKEQDRLFLVENGQYAITYNDGSRYILHGVVIENEKAYVDRNKQKIVEIEGLEYEVKYFDEIKVGNE